MNSGIFRRLSGKTIKQEQAHVQFLLRKSDDDDALVSRLARTAWFSDSWTLKPEVLGSLDGDRGTLNFLALYISSIL